MARSRSGTITREVRIAEILDQVADGELVLPEFQRDFDWGVDRVRQLLATIVKRWPAGSLLFQEYAAPSFYRLRGFDGGPPIDNHRVTHSVMDGQQRLTALFHAIYDTGPYVYAVRASALRGNATIDSIEEGISAFARADWDRARRSAPWNEEDDWIPFYALRSPADFFQWRDATLRRGSPGSRMIPRDRAEILSEAYRLGLEAFHTFTIPVVIVERNLEPEAVARIFERVNRGGLRLSAFDLMVAKTFEPGWNLREKWDLAQESYPALEDFLGEDGMPIVRAIALKSADSVREADVLGLPGLAVREDWKQAVEAMDEAVHFLRTRCGVASPDWLPYSGMLVTLADIALETRLDDHATVLERWFWQRAFGLRYENASNTVTVEEYHHLRKVLNGEAELIQVSIGKSALLEATKKRRSALWRTFMAALWANGALDIATGTPIELEGLSVVHLFPREFDPSPGLEPQHLRILNLVLSNRGSARQTSGHSGIVMRDAPDGVSIEPAVAMQSQFVPATVSELSSEEFLKARLLLLSGFLLERAGVAPSD